MNINLIFETILILFAILASNGIIYSFTYFNLNKPNSSENISVITNSSEKDGLALTTLIASNPLSLTSSESSSSQALSVTSSRSNVSQDIFDNEDWVDSEISWATHIEDSSTNEEILSSSVDVFNNITSSTPFNIFPPNVDVFDNNSPFDIFPASVDVFGNATSFTSLDSRTILDTQTLETLREVTSTFYWFPTNTPSGVLIDFKMDVINVLYSQDIIHFGISQTELRLIIEHIPSWSLFNPEINHLILTIMSYYHC
jgi:hypothetical protein